MSTGDYVGFDSEDYQSQIDQYQTSIGKGLAAAAAINKSADSAVDKVNATVSEATRIVGEPLLAASTANLITKATKGLRGKPAPEEEAGEDAGQDAGDVAETSIDAAADAAADSAGSAASAGVDAAQAAGTDLIEAGADAATDGAGAAANIALNTLSKVTKVAGDVGDVSEGLEGAAVGTEVAAAAEGGLNPIADLAALGVGLAVTLTGLFKKKHDPPAVVPPPVANPSFQFGV